MSGNQAKSPRDKYSSLLEDKEVKRWSDNVARGSSITAEVYLRRLGSFCAKHQCTPGALVAMGQRQLEAMLLDLVTEMQHEGKAGSYISSNIKAVKSWLAFNDVEVKSKKIKIEGAQETPSLKDERVPEVDELRRIFLSCDLKQRACAVLMAHSGLRPQTLGSFKGEDGLRMSDIPEIEIKGKKKASFSKIPAMVRVRSVVSKAGHEYFSFLSEEGCGYLKDYIEDRLRSGEKIDQNSAVIVPKVATGREFIRTSNVGNLVRVAIRKSGFMWRPYVLRSFFDTQMMIAESKGYVQRDYRVFFMGHKGDIERRYTLGKRRLPPDVIEDLRSSYRKASALLITSKSAKTSEGEAREAIRKAMLEDAGFKEEELSKLDLATLTSEQFQELVRKRLFSSLAKNGNTQFVVSVADVKDYLTKGYSFEANLGNGEAVLRVPAF